jgi:hypothetical protein
VAGREDRAVAAGERRDRRAGLRPGSLLDDHELAAGVVDARLVEADHHLEREHEVAVEVAVQRVPVAGAVAEQQRGGLVLAGAVTPVEPVAQAVRPRRLLAEARRPRPGHRQEPGPQRGPQLEDEVRQRMGEVPVPPLAEAVAGHVDGGSEPAVVLEQLREGGSLVVRDQPPERRNPDVVQPFGGPVPVDLSDALRCRQRSGLQQMRRHVCSTPESARS